MKIMAYIIFGILSTVIDITTYFICFDVFKISNVLSVMIAWLIAVIFAFITNKLWVFDSKNLDSKTLIHEALTFFTCRIATGLLDLVIMYITVDLLNWNALLWKCISNFIVIVSNYVASTLIVFTTKGAKN
ncbi:MAG: GtrA family protein [Synergistaceae bacterium]|nr:GtrA family protein [Synergistaceae bacterium]